MFRIILIFAFYLALSAPISSITGITFCYSKGIEMQSQQKVDSTTQASPKVVSYVTEQQYFFAGFQQTISAVIKNVKPSIVSIGKLESGDGGVQVLNIGSGVIIDPRGYILTANQTGKGTLIAENTYKIMFFGPDHRHQFDGQIVAQDPGANLALIKIKSLNTFPFTFIGNSTLIKPGDWLIAFGSADGLTQKVVPGIVSSSGRTAKIGGRSMHNLIQTDIRSALGCIGGPYVDVKGRVVGINIGNGRAISANQSFPLLKSIGGVPSSFGKSSQGSPFGQQIAGRQKIYNSWLGVEIIPVKGRTAKQLNVPWRFLSGRRGLLVNRVVDGSPASSAGIVRGDVIYKFNQRVVGRVKEIERLIRKIKQGKVVPVKVVRGGIQQTLYIQIGKKWTGVKIPAPRGVLGGAEVDWMGVEIGNMIKENILRFDISPSMNGVVVINTEDRNITGLRIGDLIRKVNGRKVGEVSEFMAIVINSPKGVLLDIMRQGELLYLTVGQ